MNNKYIDNKLKEFDKDILPEMDENLPEIICSTAERILIKQYNAKRKYTRQFIKEALSQQREETIEECIAIAENSDIEPEDIQEELYKLKANKEEKQEPKVTITVEAAKQMGIYDLLKEKQEECFCHCHSPQGETTLCVHYYFKCTHCQKPDDFMEVESIKPEEKSCKHKGGYLLNAMNGCKACVWKTIDAFTEPEE